MLRIDGLIPVLVLELMGNVRRQGHLAQLIQNFLKNTVVGEFDQTVALIHYVQHFSHEKTVAEGNLRARLCLFARFHQRLPHISFSAFQQKNLDLGLGTLFGPVQAGGNNLGVVDDQTVPRS